MSIVDVGYVPDVSPDMALSPNYYFLPSFSGNQGFTGDFYTEICTKLLKLSKDLLQAVSLVDLQEGKQRFSKFAENGHKWNKEDYDHNGFRAVYCERLFSTRAENVYNILSFCESQKFLPHLLFDITGTPRSLNVASFGCGPSGELAGLDAYFTGLKVRDIKRVQADYGINGMSQEQYSSWITKIQSAKLERVTGYDICACWREYSECLGYSFVHQCIDQKFVEEMEPLDILIMSYFAHNADFSKPIVPLRYVMHSHTGMTDYMRKWDILQQKVKMIIVIDTSGTSEETLGALNIREFACITGVPDDKGRKVIARIWYRRDQW